MWWWRVVSGDGKLGRRVEEVEDIRPLQEKAEKSEEVATWGGGEAMEAGWRLGMALIGGVTGPTYRLKVRGEAIGGVM